MQESKENTKEIDDKIMDKLNPKKLLVKILIESGWEENPQYYDYVHSLIFSESLTLVDGENQHLNSEKTVKWNLENCIADKNGNMSATLVFDHDNKKVNFTVELGNWYIWFDWPAYEVLHCNVRLIFEDDPMYIPDIDSSKKKHENHPATYYSIKNKINSYMKDGEEMLYENDLDKLKEDYPDILFDKDMNPQNYK